MMVWLGACVIVALLAWVLFQTRPEPSSNVPKSRSGSARKAGAAARPSGHLIEWSSERTPELPKIPSLVEDDDLEITVVTASPMSESLLADDSAEKGTERESGDKPKGEASRVEVIYEEEAEFDEITSPLARILVSAHGQTDGGKVRERNEDSLLVFPERSLFAVADGMGGYVGGQVASALAVESLRGAYDRSSFDARTESDVPVPRRGREMACAIQMANQAILAEAHRTPELAQMGTTIVAAQFSPNKQRVYIGHVGDSRCYRLRGKVLRQLTTDHTMRQLGMKGPGSNHLFQAVGIGPTITIDIVIDKPRANDLYLLCSDGLSKMANDDEIREMLLLEPDIDEAVDDLIALANDEGGKDNITVILVKVVELPSKSPLS